MTQLIPVPEAGHTCYIEPSAVAFIRPVVWQNVKKEGECNVMLVSGLMLLIQLSADEMAARVEGRSPKGSCPPSPPSPSRPGIHHG